MLKVLAVSVSFLILSTIGTCTYRSFREEGTCYVETYAGVSYIRRRSGPEFGPPADVWGPKISSIEEAPAAAKILGCELR